VERGYEDRGDRTVLLILSVVAGLVVLGGTLAATSLALSEARPDLSTLGQVGARPGTRRAVAGGYAYVLSLVGAGLGVLAGLIPGVAAALALTSSSYGGGWVVNAGVADHLVEQPRFYLDIPWWLLALVLVLLPLVAAGVAAAATRSRLDGPTRALA
jgi:putative ABC transport system permease protein